MYLEKKRLLQMYEYMHHFLARLFVMILLILQICIINNILAYYKGTDKWWSLLIPDTIYFVFFLIHTSQTYRIFVLKQKNTDENKLRFPWGPLAWVIYSVVLCSKIIVIFTTFAPIMEEGTIVGPNTLRAMIGVTAIIFFLILMSHMHKDINPTLRLFLYSIGATVPIDLLDTMDVMELLYTAEENRMITGDMLNMILFIIVVNLLIPVFPLSVLHIPNIHKKRMFPRLMIIQKVIQIIIINFLFMTVRLVLWQHFGKGFSTFILKNVLMISILMYDIFGICREDHEIKKEKQEPKIVFEKGEVYI